MYLWDLNLDEIPLGWKETYDDALANYPDGKFVDVESIRSDVNRYWIHPVQFHDLLKQTFDKLKAEARLLVKNKEQYELREFVSQIVHLDVGLYFLLFEWYFERNLESDYHNFSPFEFFSKEKYFSYQFYFAPPITKLQEEINDMRVICHTIFGR